MRSNERVVRVEIMQCLHTHSIPPVRAPIFLSYVNIPTGRTVASFGRSTATRRNFFGQIKDEQGLPCVNPAYRQGKHLEKDAVGSETWGAKHEGQ